MAANFSISKMPTGRIGDGLAEDALRVRAETAFQLLFADVRIDEGAFDAHLLHRYAKQIVCPAVDRTGGDEVIAGLTDVEYGKEVGAWPDDVSIPATPPSIAAIFAATASLVGFCRRE